MTIRRKYCLYRCRCGGNKGVIPLTLLTCFLVLTGDIYYKKTSVTTGTFVLGARAIRSPLSLSWPPTLLCFATHSLLEHNQIAEPCVAREKPRELLTVTKKSVLATAQIFNQFLQFLNFRLRSPVLRFKCLYFCKVGHSVLLSLYLCGTATCFLGLFQ